MSQVHWAKLFVRRLYTALALDIRREHSDQAAVDRRNTQTSVLESRDPRLLRPVYYWEAFRLSDRTLAAGRFRGHKAPSTAEQVPQSVLLNPRQSHQHGGIVRVVIGDVVHIRSTRKELRSLIEIDANAQRARLRGFVHRNTRQRLPANFEGRRSVCRGLLHVRQLECDFSHCIEIDLLPWH